ncbi:ATP-binding cassette domain-containing protein [Lactococcus protaetiae]|uniref:ABC transporter ATP-binding protein n=1 Tax=Lactococcus protaetiae TaxID=2592653 RepID=A0A514Z683_9LACT|nr:ABC transporter ATP-binding protein [Lactococcus protaetiae]MCL2114308.1 ABC transporter ATP-binding protein [Streptococcaceae bacterium]QDK70063.1 ABC transporter ATP-binding protein [Lactococcus protaetiae]
MRIDAERITFAYGDRRVLRDLSVTFEAGKVYGIVGKNGAGKTTFFKVLTNIITNYQGTVKIADVDVKANPEVLAKVGILLDDIELYKSYTGWFNLRYFGGLRGNFDEEKVRQLAAKLGIDDALGKRVSSYSLGMGKKLILLISLMNDAEILIFDEPFRGIDAASVAWFRETLLSLKKEGKLILISSHVQEDIEMLCDVVYGLSDGKFTDSFDLNDKNQVLTYRVVVSDVSVLTEILSARGLVYQVEHQVVSFDATVEKFQEVFQESVGKGLIFDEIKKDSKFVEFVK